MKRKFFFASFFLLTIILSMLFLIKNNLKRQENNEKRIKKENQIIKTNKIEEKQKTVFFDYQKEKISKDEYLIKIFLKGDKDTLIDGADLSLFYINKATKIEEVTSGDSFPLYPRKIINDNKILITGIAKIKNNQTISGKINANFAYIKIKISDSPLENFLIINEDTGVYFRGKNILNLENSFQKINL